MGIILGLKDHSHQRIVIISKKNMFQIELRFVH